MPEDNQKPAAPIPPSRPSQTGLPDQGAARGPFHEALRDLRGAIVELEDAMREGRSPHLWLDMMLDDCAAVDTAALDAWEAR